MYLVGNEASAAHDVVAPNQNLTSVFYQQLWKSCFDVADVSVLINVKMDSTVQDCKENTSTAEKKTRMERKLFSNGPIFPQILQWILQA